MLNLSNWISSLGKLLKIGNDSISIKLQKHNLKCDSLNYDIQNLFERFSLIFMRPSMKIEGI